LFPSSLIEILSITSKLCSTSHLIFLYAVVWGILVSMMMSYTDLVWFIVESIILTISESANTVRIAFLIRSPSNCTYIDLTCATQSFNLKLIISVMVVICNLHHFILLI